MSSSGRTSVEAQIGPDGVELVRLVHEDLARHESALNEHQRTALTIRGFALTAVAGLLAGSFATWVPSLGGFAATVLLMFLVADYYYSRLYTRVERSLPVLESLSTAYRRLLSRPLRSRDDIDDFRGDLRTYADKAAAPDTRPRLWPIESLGRLKVFLPVYGVLLVFAVVSAWYVSAHERPGSRRDPATVVCIGRPSSLSNSPQKTNPVTIMPCADVDGLMVP
jgi:hypothetical protein